MARKSKLSPLMEQYRQSKKQYPDSILLCRVGDFYEAFYDDAELIARVLEITLTSRDKDSVGGAIPMAGVPHHALDSYLYKLVNSGYKVAILEQVEDAKKSEGRESACQTRSCPYCDRRNCYRSKGSGRENE